AAGPSDPGQALATRAFIATARMRPGRSASRSASYTTGAARTAFLVNTPAVAQLVADTSKATSGVPSGLSPAWAAPAAKPRGEVTDPSDTGSSIGGQDSPRGSLVKLFAVPYHSATFPGGPFDVGTVPQLRRLRRTRASALHRRTLRRSDRGLARRPRTLPPHDGAARGYGVLAARPGGVCVRASRPRGGDRARPAL